MSEKEAQRLRLLELVMEGRMTLFRAAELMGVCYRHAKRHLFFGLNQSSPQALQHLMGTFSLWIYADLLPLYNSFCRRK